MPIIQWNPFVEPWDFEKEMEKFFEKNNSNRSVFAPAMDVYQDNKNVHVEMSVAGVKPENIEISIDQSNILTLKGETERKTEIDDKNFIKKEIRYGTFFQRVALPSHVKSEKARATYDNGVLKISIPIASEKVGKVVKVKLDKPKKNKKK